MADQSRLIFPTTALATNAVDHFRLRIDEHFGEICAATELA